MTQYSITLLSVLILQVMVLSNAFATELSLREQHMAFPKDFGVLYDVEHYSQMIDDKKLIKVPARIRNFVQNCRIEHGPYQRCRNEKLKLPCSEDPEKFVWFGNISYCSNSEADQLTLELPMNIHFRHYNKRLNYVMPQAPKNMMYSAINCMTAIYAQYNINLNVQTTEEDDSKYDVIVSDGLRMLQSMRLISIGGTYEYYNHEKLCQVVNHELSHHFGIPDRYGRKECPLLKVYHEGSMMASLSRLGYQGISIIEEDLFEIFGHACPGTVNAFQTHPDTDLPPNLPLDPRPEPTPPIVEEPEKSFQTRLKEFFSGPLFR